VTPEEIQQKIREDPDFVNLPRFNFSAKAVAEKFPDGAPHRLIAQAFGLREEQVAEEYDRIVAALRRAVTG
jgi:hypothetical protein